MANVGNELFIFFPARLFYLPVFAILLWEKNITSSYAGCNYSGIYYQVYN